MGADTSLQSADEGQWGKPFGRRDQAGLMDEVASKPGIR